MNSYRLASSLALVLLAHIGALAALLLAPAQAVPPRIEPPMIQGVIISSPPITSVEAPSPTPPKKLPSNTPLPKLPQSKRAVTEETLPVEVPSPPVSVASTTEKPVEMPALPPRADATELNNAAPLYPSQSRKLGEEGTVLLEVLVKADGSLGDLRLKQSSGYRRLDEAALRAVKRWHFLPATRAGEAIDFWYELPIEFFLKR